MSAVTVTQQQFEDFIMSQDDNREIDMKEVDCEANCGCIMIHYGKEKLNINSFQCSFSEFSVERENILSPVAKFENSFISSFIVECSAENVKTYKEAKEIWQNKLNNTHISAS